MKKRIIFSIYIDIPANLLDETGYSNHAAVNDNRLGRAQETKHKIACFSDRLRWTQHAYAKDACNADYKLFTFDQEFINYYKYVKGVNEQIPMYHIINYYKNHLLQELAKEYDEVFYMDLDIIPRPHAENIFEVFDMDTLWAKNNNDLAAWATDITELDLSKYNSCDRNPATKYWNCYALLIEKGFPPDNDVINTGTIIGGKDVIMEMDWQGEFETVMEDLKYIQNDEFSMFPKALRDRFAYDNETIFSYLVKSKDIKYGSLPNEWHGVLHDEYVEPSYKIIHAINKKFELVWFDIQW